MTYTSALTYATQSGPLDAQIRILLSESEASPVDFRVMSLIVPNSDHTDGAPLAAKVYRSLPEGEYTNVISIASNRGEEFKRITVCSLDRYDTPLGPVPVSDAIRNELCDEDDDIFIDDRGHFLRHGLDVNLPFLQHRLEEFSVVPLVMGTETPEFCRELGSAVGEVMANRRTLAVACVDIVEASERGLELFRDNLQTLNVPAMLTLLNQEQEIRIEGKGPLLVAMMASLHRRANEVSVCDITAPTESRPGFAGALIGRV
ncbi:MAG: AmmeMemoRadiSam system protein B [Bacteroidota bacterium]|nr:AmmeMemoRadiSam system protein B [Bacteroidota bacterium]